MYNFIDVEASGLGTGSYPIEVGVALADGTRNCTLVCPTIDWLHWDDKAEELHGITREKLLLNGRSVLKVALMLNEWLRDGPVYSDAWGNDTCWLSALYREAGVRQRFRVESMVTLLSEYQLQHWHATKNEVIARLDLRRHRASNDAMVLQSTVALLMQRYPAHLLAPAQAAAASAN